MTLKYSQISFRHKLSSSSSEGITDWSQKHVVIRLDAAHLCSLRQAACLGRSVFNLGESARTGDVIQKVYLLQNKLSAVTSDPWTHTHTLGGCPQCLRCREIRGWGMCWWGCWPMNSPSLCRLCALKWRSKVNRASFLFRICENRGQVLSVWPRSVDVDITLYVVLNMHRAETSL